jgi:ATP/maltotriose-dependent transcriptional regulator MalT
MVLERGSQGAETVVEKRSLSAPTRKPVGIRRDAILHRLNAARPRLVMAIAPAGYGKSTVLRQYAAEFDASAICNCLDVSNQVEFAQEVAKALADGDPPRTAALAQQHLAGSGNAGWEAFAMDSWSKANAHDLFVFENVECILDSIDNVAFLSRLLARTPGERSLAIGSRRALPFSWHRFFAPHQVLALHGDELRFEAPEIAQAFTGLDISSDSLARVAEITRGWPIAVFLLARLAREGSLVAHFERLGGIDFEDLYDYLSDQVLATMPPKRFARLLAVAAIPRATGAEVAKALDDPEAHDDLVEFARTSPFLYSIGDDTYEAHPLVRAMLAERYPERWREWLLKAADALAPTHPDRAALLYLAGGNQDAAADSLEAMLDAMASDLTPVAAEVIGRLETEVLLRHPSAWPASMTVRSANITLRQWLNEATVARERITPATPLPVRLGILTSFVDVLTNLGRHEEALEAIKEFDRPEVPPQNRIIGRLYESGIAARQGRFGRAMEIWAGIEPLLAEAKYALSRGIEEIPVRAARFAGDRETERTLLERSIAMTRETQSAVGIALVLEEATFAAWLAGEDELYERYARELEAAIVSNTTQGTEAFRA